MTCPQQKPRRQPVLPRVWPPAVGGLMTLTILGHVWTGLLCRWRLLTLLLTGLGLALSSWRPVTPLPRPRPAPPLPGSPRFGLTLPIASPGYRDGLRPVPEPARVRPYLVAEEQRRDRGTAHAELCWWAEQYPDPVPDPVPEAGPDPELPRLGHRASMRPRSQIRAWLLQPLRQLRLACPRPQRCSTCWRVSRVSTRALT